LRKVAKVTHPAYGIISTAASRDIVCKQSSNECISEVEQIEAKVKRLLLWVREEKIWETSSVLLLVEVTITMISSSKF
jgi:hypothetical protein